MFTTDRIILLVFTFGFWFEINLVNPLRVCVKKKKPLQLFYYYYLALSLHFQNSAINLYGAIITDRNDGQNCKNQDYHPLRGI